MQRRTGWCKKQVAPADLLLGRKTFDILKCIGRSIRVAGPLIMGKGKTLFAMGVLPGAFALSEHAVTPKGVIFANYIRAGSVQTGSTGE